MNNEDIKSEDLEEKKTNFVRSIIDEEIASGKHGGRVHTRFPPEPNGYLHVGHAKSICLNFGIARDYKGQCNLRFDDTNPTKEDTEYVDSIMDDIRWLGFQWDELHYASDYFEQLYKWAISLIEKGLAYVDDQSAEEISKTRGIPSRPGQDSPYRSRTIEENLDLFKRMKAGEFGDGAKVLRARIDMASPNMNMRDPVMYRVLHAEHHRTGNEWCIYPMYDFTHGQSDSIENITNSICTLEFENHRPLYDWFLNNLDVPSHPRQTEFARLNISYTVMSKRKLLQLVNEKSVDGWDDPRMPTICGMRRRGYTPESIRTFADKIGLSKTESMIDMAFLEYIVREDLNKSANRVMAVLDPLKVIITNYPEGQIEMIEAVNNPGDESAGTRKVPFGREIYIERTDFMEEPARKYFRLAPDKEVRLKHAFYITCNKINKDEKGEILSLECTYDPESRGGETPDGRKVKGTLQWVSAEKGLTTEVRLYDKLFTQEDMGSLKEGEDYRDFIDPNSLIIKKNCIVEPSLAEAKPGESYQFLRTGYFCADSRDFTKEHPVFNRTVALKDSWAKLVKKQGK